MELHEAVKLIRQAVSPTQGTWADIGAGTGAFTEALLEILHDSKVIAVDKSPHALYALQKEWVMANRQQANEMEILEGDFHHLLNLSPLDGILMANALHYANDHLLVLQNVITSLKPGGTFILIEYDTDKPNPPWVPNPIPLMNFTMLCKDAGLEQPTFVNSKKSIYQDGNMYVVKTSKRIS